MLPYTFPHRAWTRTAFAFVLYCVAASPARTQDTAFDSEEVLLFVEKTAQQLEKRLNDAVTIPEATNLLIKLAESYEDFSTIAQMGIYCQGARVAAEMGRGQCNWMNFTKEKDLQSLTFRAQEARLLAFKMRDAVTGCLAAAQQQPNTEKTLTMADIIRSNAEHIDHTLYDGLASRDLHILAQKIEQAERIFRHTEMLTQQLNNCSQVVVAARSGFQACTDALAAKTWGEAETMVQKALTFSGSIRAKAGTCR